MTKESDGMPFIHSSLDDYGLTPQQFRIVCRIARRGACSESIPNMAARCKMHPKTVAEVLRFLLEHQLVTKENHAGKPSVYRLYAPATWQPLPPPNGYPPQTDTRVFKWGDYHPQTDTHEGT
jgi:hypothetical protein